MTYGFCPTNDNDNSNANDTKSSPDNIQTNDNISMIIKVNNRKIFEESFLLLNLKKKEEDENTITYQLIHIRGNCYKHSIDIHSLYYNQSYELIYHKTDNKLDNYNVLYSGTEQDTLDEYRLRKNKFNQFIHISQQIQSDLNKPTHNSFNEKYITYLFYLILQ